MSALGPTAMPESLFQRGPSRREVLRWLAYSTAAGVGGGLTLTGCSPDDGARSASKGAGGKRPQSTQRTLIVIELGGGNDGLSTLVPYEDGTYHDLRPSLALDGDAVKPVAEGLGINALLSDVWSSGLAVISGVGMADPVLSHFEMLDRWWRGSTETPLASDGPAGRSGFLGRLCDVLQEDERFTGITLNFGNAPCLRSNKAPTTGLPAMEGGFLSEGSDQDRALRSMLTGFASGKPDDPLGQARQGIERMLWIVELLGGLPPASKGYPDTEFGYQLAIASRVARSDAGVRVIHVPMTLTKFDTHANHAEMYPQLLTEFNDGLHALVKDLENVGLSDQVLIATTSEFGRRPGENNGGIDHGTASCMMMMGPVKAGLHGEPSSLKKLDPNGNLIGTLSFQNYLATLATWMEVDPARVLSARTGEAAASAIPGLLVS